MYFPGGCNIGTRPINLHLDGFKKLGATIIEKGDKYIIYADKLKGEKIYCMLCELGELSCEIFYYKSILKRIPKLGNNKNTEKAYLFALKIRLFNVIIIE